MMSLSVFSKLNKIIFLPRNLDFYKWCSFKSVRCIQNLGPNLSIKKGWRVYSNGGWENRNILFSWLNEGHSAHMTLADKL